MTHPSTWTSPACPQRPPPAREPGWSTVWHSGTMPALGPLSDWPGGPRQRGRPGHVASRLPPVGLGLGFSSESGLAGLGRRSTASRPAPRAGPEDRSGSATAPAGATRLGSPMGTRSRLETRLLAPLVRPRVDENTRVTIPHHALYLPARVALASAAGGSSGWSPRPFHSPPSLRRLSLFFLI